MLHTSVSPQLKNCFCLLPPQVEPIVLVHPYGLPPMPPVTGIYIIADEPEETKENKDDDDGVTKEKFVYDEPQKKWYHLGLRVIPLAAPLQITQGRVSRLFTNETLGQRPQQFMR